MSSNPSSYDWPVIEIDFVMQGLTISQLADKYGPNRSTIQRQSIAGGWMRKRQEHQSQVHQRLQKKAIEEKVDTQLQVLRIADAVLSIFSRQLAGMVVQWEGGQWVRADAGTRITPRDAVDWVKLKLLIEGEPTERSEVQLNVTELLDKSNKVIDMMRNDEQLREQVLDLSSPEERKLLEASLEQGGNV